jgi:hypothetical protein
LRNASTEAKRQREAHASGDISLSQIEIDAAKLERVIDDLTVELGCKYCQHTLKMSDADFNTLPVEQVLQNMRNLAQKIHLKRFYGARTAFKAIRAWLVAHKFEHHTTNIPSGIMIMYFAEAQAKGRARLREKGAAGNESDNDDPVWEASGAPPREGPKKYTGKSSGNFHRKGVALLNSHYVFQWDLQSVSSQIQVDGVSDLPEAAQVKNLKMVSELEEFCDNEEHSIFERSFASAILFCTWACMRLQQEQKVCIQGIRLAASGNPLDSIVEGFVILDKGRKRRDMRPRPFWMPLYGITGSRGWFDLLWSTLEGVRDKCYVFRAFHPAGPISKAEKFLKQSAQYDDLLKVFREVLERACNLTPAQGKVYSCHSPRHFLPEVARARDEAETCRVELGRWSGSVTQMAALMPVSAAVRSYEMK